MACKQTPTATLFGESVISSLGVSTLVQTDLQTVVIDGISLITTSTCVTAVPPVIIGRRQVSCRQMVITSRFGSQSKCCILPARSYATRRLHAAFGFGQLRGCAVARLPSSRLPTPSYYHTAVLPRIRAATMCTLQPHT